MRMRRTSLAASLLSLTLSASAMAQAPTGGSPTDAAYPAMSQADYPSAVFDDGWDLDWQWRFSADAVYMRRNNRAANVPVISGPEAFRFSDFDFDYEYGTRLSLGVMEGDYELEVTFLSLRDWTESRNGSLANGLDFDGPIAFGAAASGAQMAVDPGVDPNPNFLSADTYFSSLNLAANAASETDALDFLQPGAAFQAQYRSDFQDIEVNYKQRNQPGRWLRWGLGFRNVKVREDGLAAFSGTFGSVDANGVGAPSTVGLPSAALTGAGLTFVTGGTDDGFLAADTLLFTSRTLVENQLNGVQAVADMKWLESDYFDLGGFVKAGVFHNDATASITEQYTATGSNTSAYTRTLTDDDGAVSFLGHAGITGRLCVHQNVRLTAGYEAIYVGGLALAPDQVQAANSSLAGTATFELRNNGSMFIHGGRVGLEILFP